MGSHGLFGISVLGHALIDVQLGLIGSVNLINQTVHPISVRLDNVGIAALVDLPAVVDQPGSSNVSAMRASPLHLLEVQIATIGEVEGGWLLGSRLLAVPTGGRRHWQRNRGLL